MEKERVQNHVKERRLLRVFGGVGDLISFSYHGRFEYEAYFKSESTINDFKDTIGHNHWFGRSINPSLIQLYAQPDPADDETLIGPLPILDKLGKYLDGNQAIIVVKFITMPFPKEWDEKSPLGDDGKSTTLFPTHKNGNNDKNTLKKLEEQLAYYKSLAEQLNLFIEFSNHSDALRMGNYKMKTDRESGEEVDLTEEVD